MVHLTVVSVLSEPRAGYGRGNGCVGSSPRKELAFSNFDYLWIAIVEEAERAGA